MDSSGEPTTTARLSPVASTSSYFLQLDPTSGRIEIVDSSMAPPPNRAVELGGGDETVYEIREDDSYFLSGQFMDHDGLPEIDPVVGISDLLDKPLQGFLHDESFHAGRSLNNLTTSFSGYEEISNAERETVQQAIDEAYGSGSITLSIPTTSSNVMIDNSNNIIFSSHPQYISSATTATVCNPQVQFTVPNQQQLPVQNMSCDIGQITQSQNHTVTVPINHQLNPVVVPEKIPLPSQSHTSVVSAAPTSVITAIPIKNEVVEKVQVEQELTKESEIHTIETIAKQIMESKLGVENRIHQHQAVHPVKVVKSEAASTSQITQEDNILDNKELSPIEMDIKDSDLSVDDDFNIKIVSCYSQSQEVEQITENTSTEESNMEGEIKIEQPETDEKKTEAIQEDKVAQPEITEKVPLVPEWLGGYVDPDDELLIAFKNRPDALKTAICVFCYGWFYEKKDLQEHIINEHAKKNPKTHSCKICGAKFIARILRIRHEKTHRYDLKYPWYKYVEMIQKKRLNKHFTKRFCPAPLSDLYRNHLENLFNLVRDLNYECVNCGMEFSDEESVREHYDRLHALQPCKYCDEVPGTCKDLRQHEKDIHGRYEITENYIGGAWHLWDHWLCDESLEKEEVVSNVAYFHNYTGKSSDKPVVFEEEFIEKSSEPDTVQNIEPAKPKFAKRRRLSKGGMENSNDVNSESSDTDNFENILPRGEESEDITFVNDRQVKQGRSVTSVLPFKCELCPKSYDNEHDLKRHQRCHTGEKLTLACQFCNKLFKTHSHKKEHERTHTGEKPYVCPFCNRRFIQSSNLKKHIQTHKSQNTLQCSTCGKQFIKEASLVLHQRAHAQDRKFRCDICDRAYNYASLLKRHMRIHTGEMPYVCDLCGMLFHELVSLHYHRKKVHTGERPHKCETCGRAFILSSDLKKHVQIHAKPSTERSVSKVTRRRSKSKSFESESAVNDLTDEIKREIDSIEGDDDESLSQVDDKTLSTVSEIEEAQVDNDEEEIKKEDAIKTENVSEIPVIPKPPILRVYQRRDTKHLDQRAKLDSKSLHQDNDGKADNPITVDSQENINGEGSTEDSEFKTVNHSQAEIEMSHSNSSGKEIETNNADVIQTIEDEKPQEISTESKTKTPSETMNVVNTMPVETQQTVATKNLNQVNISAPQQTNLETFQLMHVGNAQQSSIVTLPLQQASSVSVSQSLPVTFLQSGGINFKSPHLSNLHHSSPVANQLTHITVLQHSSPEILQQANFMTLQPQSQTYLPQASVINLQNTDPQNVSNFSVGTIHGSNAIISQTSCVDTTYNRILAEASMGAQAEMNVQRTQGASARTSSLYEQHKVGQSEKNSAALSLEDDNEEIPFMEVDSISYGDLDFSNMICVAPDACEEVIVDDNEFDTTMS